MKKFLLAALIALIATAGIFTVAASAAEKDKIQIKEKFFMTQCYDIYFNLDKYEGKTITLEGIYVEDRTSKEVFTSVMRRTPGCCGDDGEIGFDFKYGGELPKPNDWIEVSGKLVTSPTIYLELKSLKVLKKRGKEFVTR